MTPAVGSAVSIRETVSEMIAPLNRLGAELTREWELELDVPRARARLDAGAAAFEPAEVITGAGDLVLPFVRATVALERAGLVGEPDTSHARDRRHQVLPLIMSWLGGEPSPRDPGRATARRAAAIVARSILRGALELLRTAAPAEGAARVERALARWTRPHCPCCGGVPDFAVRDRDGAHRTLICSRCDTPWRTSTFGCLGCGARDAPTVARISTPAIGYQLAICNSCGRYVKEPLGVATIDPLLDRVLTAELDAAAEARGLRL